MRILELVLILFLPEISASHSGKRQKIIFNRIYKYLLVDLVSKVVYRTICTMISIVKFDIAVNFYHLFLKSWTTQVTTLRGQLITAL